MTITRLKIIQPSPSNPKTGCYHCPLAPLAEDFPKLAVRYAKNAEKIREAQKFPHVILNRGVTEPWDEVDILCIGEAPGATENKQGRPFVGEGGSLLRRTVDEVLKGEAVKPVVGYANVARCQPPGNALVGSVVSACSAELTREVLARKPKVVILLGNIPLAHVTGITGITQSTGKTLPAIIPEWRGVKVVACLHPAYILRNDSAFDQFVDAMEYAVDVYFDRAEVKRGKGIYQTLYSASAVERVVDRMIAEGHKVAMDTETGSLNPHQTKFPGLLCVSISNREGVGYTIPWDHKESPWSQYEPDYATLIPDLPDEPPKPRKDKSLCKSPGVKKWEKWERWAVENRAHKMAMIPTMAEEWKKAAPKREADRVRVLRTLQRLMTCGLDKVLQHEKFDRQHLRKHIHAEPEGTVYDTLLRHLVLDDTVGSHGLDRLAATYTGMAGYDRPLEEYKKEHPECDPEKGGSYANFPGSLLFPYASMDSDVSLRVDNALIGLPDYQKNKQFQVAAEVFMPALSRTLADMEYNGAHVDLKVVAELTKKYEKKEQDAYERVRRLPRVRQFEADRVASAKKVMKEPFRFKPSSPSHVSSVLFDYYGLRPTELTDKGAKIIGARLAHRMARKRNADKDVEVQELIEEAVSKREWFLFSTSQDVLQIYDHEGNDFVPPLLEHREFSKILSTYLHPIREQVSAGDLVHGHFNQTGTATGRLSSSSPNLQNQPDEARKAYTSRFPGGFILQADYSQIELRVASCLFDDPIMRKVYMNNGDIHAETAQIISNKTAKEYAALSDGDKKHLRRVAKRVNFGSIYCIGPSGIQRTLRKDGVFITLSEAEKFLETFFQKRPQLKEGMQRQEDYCRRHGYVRLFTGRLRRLPDIHASQRAIAARAARQAVNAPVQGSSSEILTMGMVLTHREMQKRKMRSLLCVSVHDSLVLDCVPEEVMELARMVKETMENVHKLSESVWPGLDWAWLKVPLVSEVSLGRNWDAMIDFTPAVIDKGIASDENLHWRSDKGEFMHRAPTTWRELVKLTDLKIAA